MSQHDSFRVYMGEVESGPMRSLGISCQRRLVGGRVDLHQQIAEQNMWHSLVQIEYVWVKHVMQMGSWSYYSWIVEVHPLINTWPRGFTLQTNLISLFFE